MNGPTREQIDAALVRMSQHGCCADDIATLRSALTALTALTAELKAHAETRALLNTNNDFADTQIEWQISVFDALDVNTAGDGVDSDATDESMVRAEAEALTKIHAVVERDTAWQTATGHASPDAFSQWLNEGAAAVESAHAAQDAYRASRVEPGADLIAHLRKVFDVAAFRAVVGSREGEFEAERHEPSSSFDAGIRAVLVTLAEMGKKAMPSDAEAIRASEETPIGLGCEGEATAVARLFRSRLAPVLGARMALTPCKEEIADIIRAHPFYTGWCDDAARTVLERIRSRSTPPIDEQLAEEVRR